MIRNTFKVRSIKNRFLDFESAVQLLDVRSFPCTNPKQNTEPSTDDMYVPFEIHVTWSPQEVIYVHCISICSHPFFFEKRKDLAI